MCQGNRDVADARETKVSWGENAIFYDYKLKLTMY